ncbi:type II secretion system F family protein, partial [Patescibacteria group bacterium]|nr:type II secretion system F family protein [Patescibacteria group bacterium]
MAKFNYRAKEKSGKSISGVVEAPDIEAAQKLLKEREMIVIEVNEKKGFNFSERYNQIFSKVGARDVVLFSRQLAVLISSTVPLVRALRILVKQTENKYFKNIISMIVSDVDGGMKLSESLSHYPKIFDDFFIHMVRAGETTGRLDEVLTYLADQKEKDYLLMGRIRNAMIYPAVIISVLGAVGIFSLVYTIPRMTAVLIDSGVDLPWTTKILISISEFAKDYWWIIVIFIITLAVIFYFVRNLTGFRYQIDYLKLKAPILGKTFRKIYLTRFARSFSNLIAAGVPITGALDIVSEIVSNQVYANIIKEASREVETGTPIYKVFAQSKFVPPMMTHTINIGEETGRLDQILQKLADFYATEVESGIQTLVALIEPLVIVILAMGAVFLVLSVLMPMY